MAKEIWKFPLGDGMEQRIDMPMHAEILTVQMQHGHTCLWAMVDPENVKRPRTILIVGTGHDVPQDARRYIGTVQHDLFVWHIFEGDMMSGL